MESFIKCKRSADTLEISKRPNELTLFFNIAINAKRSERFSVAGLEIGETLVKGCRECGLSERSYRTAKTNLEKWGFVTSRPTNRGTVFKIINSDIFDINPEQADEQNDNLPTSYRQASDEQPTSTIYTRRKECKNEKKFIPPTVPHEAFEQFWKAYPKKKAKGQALTAWKKLEKSKQLPDPQVILDSIASQKTCHDWQKNNGQYIPHPSTWLNGMCWEDETTNRMEVNLHEFSNREYKGTDPNEIPWLTGD